MEEIDEPGMSQTGEIRPNGEWRAWRYEIENEEFVLAVSEEARYIEMWDGPNLTYADLLRDYPHRAYVIAVADRLHRLVQRYKSLNLIDKMLEYDALPLETSTVRISNYEWLKIILDSLLSRVTSIRDCTFLLVANIFELGVPPRSVTLKLLRKGVADQLVIDRLTRVSRAARGLREERDRHLHRGEERALSDMDFFFKLMSNSSLTTVFNVEDPEGGTQKVSVDPQEMYRKAISGIRDTFHGECDELLMATKELLEAINEEFDKRWVAKRELAKDLRAWEVGKD